MRIDKSNMFGRMPQTELRGPTEKGSRRLAFRAPKTVLHDRMRVRSLASPPQADVGSRLRSLSASPPTTVVARFTSGALRIKGRVVSLQKNSMFFKRLSNNISTIFEQCQNQMVLTAKPASIQSRTSPPMSYCYIISCQFVRTSK